MYSLLQHSNQQQPCPSEGKEGSCEDCWTGSVAVPGSPCAAAGVLLRPWIPAVRCSIPWASIPVCLSGKHNVTSSFLAEATVEGEVWFSIFFWNLSSVNRLEGLGGEKVRFLTVFQGEELLHTFLPANCHCNNDWLPARVQHLPSCCILLGNDDPDGQQSYEEGAHQRIHVCFAL